MSNDTEQKLKAINDKLENLTSLRQEFKRGVVRGLGAAIGASIIAAVVLAGLSQIINTVDDVPIVEDIIEKTRVKKAVDEQ